MTRRATAVTTLLAALLSAGTAAGDPPPPACGPEARAGRVHLVAGDTTDQECWCYTRRAETCVVQHIERCRGDLQAVISELAAAEARHQQETAQLDAALKACAADLEHGADQVEQQAHPRWDRAWVGAAAVGAAVIVVRIVVGGAGR